MAAAARVTIPRCRGVAPLAAPSVPLRARRALRAASSSPAAALVHPFGAAPPLAMPPRPSLVAVTALVAMAALVALRKAKLHMVVDGQKHVMLSCELILMVAVRG